MMVEVELPNDEALTVTHNHKTFVLVEAEKVFESILDLMDQFTPIEREELLVERIPQQRNPNQMELELG